MQNLHRLVSRLSATSLGSSSRSGAIRVLRNFSTNSAGGGGGGYDDKVDEDKSLGSSSGGMDGMGWESVSSWSTGLTKDHFNGEVAGHQAGGGTAHSAVVSDLQEIEDKLRELEAENKKSKGFVDGWGERMREMCVLLKQVREPGARGSYLKDSEKAEMYRLHKENPEVYTVEKLAKDYRIMRQRVHAILWLKELEEEEEKRLGRPLDDSVELLLDTCPE